jgi:hypothetical protein
MEQKLVLLLCSGPDNRQIICRRVAEFVEQPLLAGCFGERELSASVHRSET